MNEGKHLLQEVNDDVREALSSDSAALQALRELLESRGAVRGSGEHKVEIETDENGHGSFETKKETTWYVTISDPVHITDPDGGTWHVKVTDTAQENRLVFEHKEMEKCKEYSYRYKTGFTCKLKIEVWWSEKRKTTFKATIKYTY